MLSVLQNCIESKVCILQLDATDTQLYLDDVTLMLQCSHYSSSNLGDVSCFRKGIRATSVGSVL